MIQILKIKSKNGSDKKLNSKTNVRVHFVRNIAEKKNGQTAQFKNMY